MELRDELREILSAEYGLRPRDSASPGGHSAWISPTAKVGKDVRLGHGVVVGDGVTIADGCSIGNRVTLLHCEIGTGSVVEDNCIVGYRNATGGFSHKLDGFDDVEPTVIGDNVLIRTGCTIYHSVTIGSHTWINHNVLLRERTRVGHHTCIGSMSDSEGYNSIGNHVLIHSQVHMCARMTIEDYVFIAPFTVFTNGDPMGYARDIDSTEQGPTIGFGTQVAVNVVVLPRVVVGRESIIGASSVVTKDVAPVSVVVGVPGKVRGRVPDELRMPEDLRRQYYDGQLDPPDS